MKALKVFTRTKSRDLKKNGLVEPGSKRFDHQISERIDVCNLHRLTTNGVSAGYAAGCGSGRTWERRSSVNSPGPSLTYT